MERCVTVIDAARLYHALYALAGMWIAYTLFKAYWRLCQRKDARRAASYLDQHVFSWDSKNALTVRQLVAGGIHVFGGTGVGKTSSMKQVAKSTMQIKNSSLLVLCSKRGEYREWMDMAKAMGREKDVVLVDETQNARFNMWVSGKRQAGREEVVRFIMEIRGVIMRESNGGGGESAIWRKYDETAIRNCAIALMCAGEPITPMNLHKMIVTAPVDAKEMVSPQCLKVLQRGYRARVCRGKVARCKDGF